MSLQETVEFAQAHFGDNRGVPNLPDVRPRVPPWLEEGLEAAVPIAEGDRPVIEGDPAGASAEEGPANGASIDELYAYYLPFHFYRKG